jgi:hypothetical protein
MANIKFEHSSAGYVDVMNMAGVQSLIKNKAKQVNQTANSMLSEGGYTAINDFEEAQGQFRDGRKVQNVYTHSLHAMRSQNKKKTLTKALGTVKEG